MVVPVYDESEEPAGRPWAMWTVFSLNVIVFIVLGFLPPDLFNRIIASFGLMPAHVTEGLSDLTRLGPSLPTFISYAFLQSDWLHLSANMIFLWVLGDNVEAAFGHLRFIAFYALCAVAAAVTHILANPDSQAVLLGSSGAVCGVLAAYMMLRPRAHITVLVFGLMTLRIRALWLLAMWALIEVFKLVFFTADAISYWGHLGGLAAGALLSVVLRRPGVSLFQGDPPIGRSGATR